MFVIDKILKQIIFALSSATFTERVFQALGISGHRVDANYTDGADDKEQQGNPHPKMRVSPSGLSEVQNIQTKRKQKADIGVHPDERRQSSQGARYADKQPSLFVYGAVKKIEGQRQGGDP